MSPIPTDFAELLAHSGRSLDELQKRLEILPPVGVHGPWLAGGALRRTVMGQALDSDLDFFFASPEQCEAFCGAVRPLAKTVRETKLNKTFTIEGDGAKLVVQAIHVAYYDSPAALIESFDFTLCQLAWDGEFLWCGPLTLWDLGRKRLAVNRITYGVSSVRRLLKYSRQGFTVCNGAIAELLKQVAQKPETLTTEVISVD